MQHISYFDGKRVRKLSVEGIFEAQQRSPRRSSQGGFSEAAAFAAMKPQAAGDLLAQGLDSQRDRLSKSFIAMSESRTLISPAEIGETAVILTEAVAIDEATREDVDFLRNRYGMEQVTSGSHGKVLMRSPGDAANPVEHAAEAALTLHEERGSSSAPNFLRVVQRTPVPSVAPNAEQWGLDNAGSIGLIGADVHALAAWTITNGKSDIRVAILDEGVDSSHPSISPQIVAEADFVDGNSNARPDGDDAHGTACAGIVASQDNNVSGLGPGLSLVGVRIAKSGANGFWIFDDFATADAIDWAWDSAVADVLSNSWGGGPPSPVITSAFRRAAANGRNGLGAVVVVAAGNSQTPVDYPGNLRGVLTVGASNEWDKRKTRSSSDGEHWWGSNYGRGLDVMAPGVHIATTDISGPRGYSPGDFAPAFNGTSSATPFVAATAALMLSVNPDLTEARVREIIRQDADRLTAGGGWSKYTGYGRVNAFRAVRQAREVVGVEEAAAYYYDYGGRSVRLKATEQVAVDTSADVGPRLTDQVTELVVHGEPLKGDVVLVEAADVSADLLDVLEQASAVQPVFGAEDGTRIVVMPEVRVESSDRSIAQRVRGFAESDDTDVELVSDSGSSLVLKPGSGKGEDAITLANTVYEAFGPEVSQACFVRIVPRPDSNPYESGRRTGGRKPL